MKTEATASAPMLINGFKHVCYTGQNRSLPHIENQPRSLAFSLFMWGNDDAQGRDKYRLMLEGAKYFDRNGFEAVWTPERHFHAFGGPYPNPSVTAAALAVSTERINIRAGSCVSPLHHPLRIAEEWAVVDNLSNGRVAIAFASGWQLNDFVLRPENHANNKRVMLEQIDQVRRLWRGETVLFRNPLNQEVAVQSLPRPVQPELPFWMTTAGNPETYRQAGELGANVLTHLLGQSLDEVAKKIAIYREARRTAGYDPATGRVTLMLHTFVGDDDAEVRELVRQPMKNYLRSSLKLVFDIAGSFPAFQRRDGGLVPKQNDMDPRKLPESDLEALLDFAFERYFETSGLFGTPSTCARMLERCKAADVDEIACLLDFGVPTERVMASFACLNQVRQRANAHSPATPTVARSIRLNTQSQTTPTTPSAAASSVNTTPTHSQIYAFLAALRERDIHISADGDRLRCSAPPGAVSPELRNELQKRKSDILEFLRSTGARSQQQPAIVPLQSSGTRTPIFAIGGHNGDVFCFRHLSKYLGADQPFYGLQPPGLDGKRAPFGRVEDLAAYFADQIRIFQPTGPYVIAGYCAGGTIAFELARQLQRAGATIEFVALFGSPFPTWFRALPQLRLHAGLQVKRFVRHTRAMALLSFNQRRRYVAERLRNRKTHRAAAADQPADPATLHRDNVSRITRAALPHYEPGHFAGRLVLFLPDRQLCPPEVRVQWPSVAEQTQEYFGPEGCTGDNMLREPHARALTDLFKQSCGTSGSLEGKPQEARVQALSEVAVVSG